MELLEINDKNVEVVLTQFGKVIDTEGFIVDKETNEKVKCRYTNHPLKKQTFGGILPGSSIFIEDSDIAYAGYVMEFLANDGTF